MPVWLETREGRAGREETNHHPFRSTGVEPANQSVHATKDERAAFREMQGLQAWALLPTPNAG